MVYHRVRLYDISNDCMLRLCSSSSLGHNGLVSIHNLSMLQTDLVGVVKVTQCRRILLQVRYTRLDTQE